MTTSIRPHAVAAAISGLACTPRLRDGLVLYLSDVEHRSDTERKALMPTGFGIYLFFEDGDGLKASVDGRPLPVGGHHATPDKPFGFTLYRSRPVPLVRRAKSGTRVRHVIVSLSLDWLKQTFGQINRALPSGAREHLAISRWFPSRRLGLLAAGLFGEVSSDNAISRLRTETIALEVVSEALATIRPPSAGDIERTDTLLLNRAQDMIEAHLSEELSFQAIAGEIGVSIAKLRRLFRDAYDCTVYDFVRHRRLDLARIRLEDGKPVGVVANLAGYTSSANFSTAFKHRFGITPSRALELSNQR